MSSCAERAGASICMIWDLAAAVPTVPVESRDDSDIMPLRERRAAWIAGPGQPGGILSGGAPAAEFDCPMKTATTSGPSEACSKQGHDFVTLQENPRKKGIVASRKIVYFCFSPNRGKDGATRRYFVQSRHGRLCCVSVSDAPASHSGRSDCQLSQVSGVKAA